MALEALKDTPTLMVTGADDVVAPPTRAIAVAAELRRCALKILPRCGHLPTQERARCSKRCGRSCSRRCSGGGGGNH